jgi:glycosyltransferase involved in cell wall biosynthesis
MHCPTLAELPPPPPGKNMWPWTEETRPVPPARPDGSLWPRISIVTPSYNQGRFIEETIRSILLQGYPDLEYIIIDGGSTDQSVEIIKKYEPWLAYWVSEEDRGQSHAINKGFSKVTGEYINWINSDDSLRPYALRTIGEAAALRPGVDIISGSRILKEPETGFEFAENLWLTSWKHYLIGMPDFPQEATFFSRYILTEVQAIDERFDFALDVAFFFRALGVARCIVLCRSLLSQMHVYAAQKTRRPDPLKALEQAILKKEYEPQQGLQRLMIRLMRTRLHKMVVNLLPAIYRKNRRRFLRIERNFALEKWDISAL